MQPLWDNLSFIKNQFKETSKQYKKIDEMVQADKLRIVPLAYIRGRSLSNVIFIVDEAQNLTPHEIKPLSLERVKKQKLSLLGISSRLTHPILTPKVTDFHI